MGYDIDLNGLRGLGARGVSPTGDDAFDYDLSEFKTAFIDELLYSGTDPSGRSWSRNYSLDHIDQTCLDAILRECESFGTIWRDAIEAGKGFEAAGHDFLLTRNRNTTAGFWDGDWAEGRDALTAAAEAYPPLTLYDGGDGFLYVERYETGMRFDYSGGHHAINVLLPNGSWAGPFADSDSALAETAYWEVVNAGAVHARATKPGGPVPADGGGYDIDLNGLGAAAREQADVFARAFGETLLQLSPDFRSGYTIDSLAVPTWNAIVAECRTFQAMFGAQLGDLTAAGAAFAFQRSGDSYRGFWNGQWPEPLATELVVGSNAYPRVWLYLGDDGQLYGEGYELGARHFVEAGLHTVPAEERRRTNGLQGLGAGRGPTIADIAVFNQAFFYTLLEDSNANYSAADIAPQEYNALASECAAFAHRFSAEIERGDGYEIAGFRFAATRLYPGEADKKAAGFLDLGWPDENALADAAEAYPTVSLYVGDDGRLHVAGYEQGAHQASSSAQPPAGGPGYDIDLGGLGASGGPSNSDIAEFSSGFFEALLWSSTGDDENPLDANYEVGDIDKLARDALERECAAFARRWSTEIQNGMGYDRAGHDFALTRNRHGAGFWDGDWPVDGDVLTAGSQDYPSLDLYVGDDGKLYVSGYEMGAHFNYNGPREVEVMLPDATYIGPFGSDALAYEAYRTAAVVDDVGWRPGTFAEPPDNSPGYKIDLDGLRGLGAPGGPTDAELNEFKASFFDTALEFTVDPADGIPLNDNYTVDDIAQPALAALVRECEAFARMWSTEIERGFGYEQAGHCFFMTRNIVEEYTFADLWVSDVATDAEELNAAAMRYPIVDLGLGDPRFIGQISVEGYQLGAFIRYDFIRGSLNECKVLLPDGSWLGPYPSEDDALAAYWAATGGAATAIYAPPRRSPPPDEGGGYDMDLDGLRGSWRGTLAEANAARLYTKCFMLFDNGGRTADRYTLIAKKPLTALGSGVWRPLYVYAGFDESPSSPQGIGTTGELNEAMFDSHEREGFVAFGQLVDLDVLPPRALQFANDFMDFWRDDLEDWDAQDWYGCDDSPSSDDDYYAESDSAPPDGGTGYDIDLDGTRRRVRRSEL